MIDETEILLKLKTKRSEVNKAERALAAVSRSVPEMTHSVEPTIEALRKTSEALSDQIVEIESASVYDLRYCGTGRHGREKGDHFFQCEKTGIMVNVDEARKTKTDYGFIAHLNHDYRFEQPSIYATPVFRGMVDV